MGYTCCSDLPRITKKPVISFIPHLVYVPPLQGSRKVIQQLAKTKQIPSQTFATKPKDIVRVLNTDVIERARKTLPHLIFTH